MKLMSQIIQLKRIPIRFILFQKKKNKNNFDYFITTSTDFYYFLLFCQAQTMTRTVITFKPVIIKNKNNSKS